MGYEKGIYIVRVEQVGDDPQTLVNRFEETDEDINQLALRLESLVEAGFIESFTIEGQALPPIETPSGLYTAILDRFWHYPSSRESKDGLDAILYDKDVERFSAAWEQGWRNRDYYFTHNAKRNIR